MTSIFEIQMDDTWMKLPSGTFILYEHPYSAPEKNAILAVSIAAFLSVLAIMILLLAITISLIRDWRKPSPSNRHKFIKSQVGVYFILMMISHVVFTVGFMLSIIWVFEGKIMFGMFCNIQAALKQFGNVACSFWVLAIAVHTFASVFIGMKIPFWICYVVVPLVWALTTFITFAGPLFYVNDKMGPWYGISAQWCWTSDSYVVPRFITEYMWMFITAAISFILYILLFLKLRGNITSNMRFTFRPQPAGPETTRVAKQMLWYPVAYSIVVFPIAGCRIYEIINQELANFEFKMASAVLFMLSGLVNVIVYTITRNIFPLRSILPSFIRRKPSLDSHRHLTSQNSLEHKPSVTSSMRSSFDHLYNPPRRTTSIDTLEKQAIRNAIARPIVAPRQPQKLRRARTRSSDFDRSGSPYGFGYGFASPDIPSFSGAAQRDFRGQPTPSPRAKWRFNMGSPMGGMVPVNGSISSLSGFGGGFSGGPPSSQIGSGGLSPPPKVAMLRSNSTRVVRSETPESGSGSPVMAQTVRVSIADGNTKTWSPTRF